MITPIDSYAALKNTQYLQDASKGTFLSWKRVFLYNADGQILAVTAHIGQRIFAVLKSIFYGISYGEALAGRKVTLLNVADIQAEIKKTDNLAKNTLNHSDARPSGIISESSDNPPQSPLRTPKKRIYTSEIPTPGSPLKMSLAAASTPQSSRPKLSQLINNVLTALWSKQKNAWDAVVQGIDQIPLKQADERWEEIHDMIQEYAENYIQSFSDLIQNILQKSNRSEDHLEQITQFLSKHGIVVYRLNEAEVKQAEVENFVQFLPRELVDTAAPATVLQLVGFQRNIQDMCGTKPGFDLLVDLTENLAAHPSFFLHNYLEKMYETIAWKHQDPESKLSLSETQVNRLLEINSEVVDVLRLWSAQHNGCSSEDFCNTLKNYDKSFIRAHVPLLLQDYGLILQGSTQKERIAMRPLVQEYFCAETIIPLLDDANPEWTCMILNALLLTYREENDYEQPIDELFENETLENLLASKKMILALCNLSEGNGKKMVCFLWHQCNDLTVRFVALSHLNMDELFTESSLIDAIKAFCADDQSIKKSPNVCDKMLVKILKLEKQHSSLDSSFWEKQIQRPEFVLLKDCYGRLC